MSSPNPSSRNSYSPPNIPEADNDSPHTLDSRSHYCDSPTTPESENDSNQTHTEWSQDRRTNYDSPTTTSETDNDDDDYDDRSSKRPRKNSTVDQISTLPDSLLISILSFLPIQHAIRTSVLSKRWRFLWTCVQSLFFYYRHCYDDGDKIRDFVSFVTETLVLYNGSRLQKFWVDFDYESRFAHNVNAWIFRAISKGTEQIRLEFCSAEGYLGENDRFVLPQILYNNSFFRELGFSLCILEPKEVVSWNSLKKLSIGYVNLSEDVIQNILSGSPVLESLELYDFYGLDRLRVDNVNLKKLIMRGYWFFDYGFDAIEEDCSGLKIWAPHVRSLEISGCFGRKNCWLVDVSSLVDVTLDCFFISCVDDCNDDYEWFQYILRGFLESLGHVKNLKLGTWALQVLSIMEAKGLCSPRLNCEYLTLDTPLKGSVLPGIASLLESSPFLKTFVITMSSSSNREYFWGKLIELYNFNGEQYWTSQKETFECLMMHLKTIKFAGLAWNYCDLNFSFAQFLLKNARVLQKMIVYPQWEHAKKPKKLSQADQKLLLSFPRSSPNAVVEFYE